MVTHLAKLLSGVSLKYSYRFLFIPATIGSITWLARNEDKVPRIRHGLVAACVGDPGKFHYKRSCCGDAEIDRAAVTSCGTAGRRWNSSHSPPMAMTSGSIVRRVSTLLLAV